MPVAAPAAADFEEVIADIDHAVNGHFVGITEDDLSDCGVTEEVMTALKKLRDRLFAFVDDRG
jgi:hypothetical protein